MNKYSLLITAILYGLVSHAQIAVIFSPKSPVGVRLNSLWDMKLLNNANSSQEVTITLDLNKKGKSIAQSNSVIIRLNPGINAISQEVANPRYSFNGFLNNAGVLDVGFYTECITVISASTKETLLSECDDFEQLALSPPLLITPDNSSVVESRYPLFTWTAPSPIGLVQGVNYSIKIAELYPNQTPNDAINRNLAIVDVYGLKENLFNYPLNSYPLKDNQKYAWNVIAYTSEGTVIGQTEVWTFSLVKDTFQMEVPIKSFIKLKIEKSSDYVSVKDILRLIYEERYSEGAVSIQIDDENKKSVFKENFQIQRGENRITLNLSEIENLKSGKFYYLSVKSQDKPSYYLTFKNL